MPSLGDTTHQHRRARPIPDPSALQYWKTQLSPRGRHALIMDKQSPILSPFVETKVVQSQSRGSAFYQKKVLLDKLHLPSLCAKEGARSGLLAVSAARVSCRFTSPSGQQCSVKVKAPRLLGSACTFIRRLYPTCPHDAKGLWAEIGRDGICQASESHVAVLVPSSTPRT